MGEIADGLIDGTFDFFTGEYLGEGGGFPRSHQHPFPWQRGYKKFAGDYGGVVNFLMQKGKTHSKANKFIKRYGVEVLKIEVPTSSPGNWKDVVMPSLKSISTVIQKDFAAFKLWFFQNNIAANVAEDEYQKKQISKLLKQKGDEKI